MTSYPKRLIEVDLPIKQISAHARREKSIRHGHISTLHIWWARRPLAACRAVICAALWIDPVDENCPQYFRDKATDYITIFANKAAKDEKLAKHCSTETWHKWQVLAKPENQLDSHNPSHLNILRNRLLDFIADFANWDNSTQPDYLETSRNLTQAAHEALGGIEGTKPLVVDPFAGGGAIPLEALRVGADAFASDLNPVAVLLNKVVLEYIPKYGHKLADEVRKWGQWVKEEAEKELAEFYPKDPDGSTPIAYLWARTIICEGPGCGAEVPLMRSLWLAKKKNKSVALKLIPNPEKKRVDFELIEKAKPKEADQGTVKRGSATCPCCDYTTPSSNVRNQFKGRKGGADDARLICVVLVKLSQEEEGRCYRLPSKNELDAIRFAKLKLTCQQNAHKGLFSLVPNEELPYLRSIFNIYLLDVTTWGSLFTSRQALALTTLAKLVREIPDKLSNKYEPELQNAIQTCLALAINKLADLVNSLCRWKPDAECPVNLFGRQAIPIIWNFAESCVLSDSSGSWQSMYERTAYAIEKCHYEHSGITQTEISSATNHSLPDRSAQIFCSDPPYYDAVPYANLSDFFYVWLKRTIGENYVDLFEGNLTPKEGEIVQLAERNPKYAYKTHQYFEELMAQAMAEGCRILESQGVGIIIFAHKSTSGWEAQLQAMVDAGWTITASWAIDTEMGTRLRAQNSAALASSIHLVCRPRNTNEIGDWRDVLQQLPQRIHEWMPRLASEGVVGADAIFACLGPALEIFSRYSTVEKASGEIVTLKEYLEYVWAGVSKEALSMIFSGADATGFEEDARITAMWLWTLSTAIQENDPRNPVSQRNQVSEDDEDEEDEETGSKSAKNSGYILEFDAARKIAQGLGANLQTLKSVVEIKGDKARLLPVAERTQYLFGKEEAKTPTKKKKKETKQLTLFDISDTSETEDADWGEKNVPPLGNTILDRIHQTMILFAAGRSEALKRFLVEEGAGTDQRFWRLAQALSALYPTGTDEKRWVDGILARKKGLGF